MNQTIPSRGKTLSRGAGRLAAVLILLFVPLASGCQSGGGGQLETGDPGSKKSAPAPSASTNAESPASESSESKAPNLTWKPLSSKEKEFHRNILDAAGTPEEHKRSGIPLKKIRDETPNLYWGVMCYVGLSVKGDKVHVALKGAAKIPMETLRDLPKWYGNMAGDVWAYREYTWVLVDYKTGKPLDVN